MRATAESPTTPRVTSTSRRIFAITLAAAGVVVLALWGDPFGLQLAGYLPILVIGWITGDDRIPSAGEVLGQWALWRSLITLTIAAILFLLARRAWPRRHLLGAIRSKTLQTTLSTAVAIAVICPLVYAVTRIAWVLGIPLGLDDGFLEEVEPIVNNGLVLALLALGGAVLTIGLTRPWGEVFPRWIPWLGGRDVPVGLARNFALVVAFLIAAAGAYFVRLMVTGSEITMAPRGAADQWGAWLPEMLWPLWALALALAALAYAERRRRSHAADPG